MCILMKNSDPTNQATEVCFSHKLDNVPNQPWTFSNKKIQSGLAQNHLTLTNI